MDCNSARQLIPFRLSGGRDLDGPDADDLDAHLAHCGECHRVAMTQRRLDQHLGKAMQAVEVPRALRDQILGRLAARPAPRRPGWLGHTVRGLAAAAAVLLLVVGWYAFYVPPRRPLQADEVFVAFNITRPARVEAGDDELRQLGALPGAPGFVNYAFLTGSPALAILPGTQDDKSPVKVAQFVFASRDRRAVVYAIPRRQFQLDEPTGSSGGYEFKMDLVTPPDSAFTYLVFYTGDSWSWLAVPEGD